MIHIIFSPDISDERLKEFEQQVESLGLKIIDRWTGENDLNLKLAINAHTVAQMSNTDTLARQFFQKQFVNCQWLY